MAVYTNLNQGSSISSVEFSPVVDGNQAFISVKKFADLPSIEKSVEAMGQNILAETVSDGKTILITRGGANQEDMLKTLAAAGEKLEPQLPKKKMDLWVVRGNFSMGGQALQLASAFAMAALVPKAMLKKANVKGVPLLNKQGREFYASKPYHLGTEHPEDFRTKSVDPALFSFAALNILANLTNIVFGAEKKSDDHKVRYLKQKINDNLAAYVPEGTVFPDANDNRMALRKEPEKPMSVAEKFTDFMHRNSVTIGEILLRYVAAVSMVFPVFKEIPIVNKVSGKVTYGFTTKHIKEGFSELGKAAQNVFEKDKHLIHVEYGPPSMPSFKNAYKTLSNPDEVAAAVGLTYLTGKTIALFSKVPDPYNPKKHTWVDTVREQVTFRLSSIIEASGGALIAYNAFAKKKTRFADNFFVPQLRGKLFHTDFLSGIGGILFTIGLTTRIFTKYGTRHVDHDELFAHAVDALAKVPPDKLSQALADTSSHLHDQLKEDAKGHRMELGEIHNILTKGLYTDHGRATPYAFAKTAAVSKAAADLENQLSGANGPARENPGYTTRITPKPRLPDGFAPPSSFSERVMTPDGTAHGIA